MIEWIYHSLLFCSLVLSWAILRHNRQLISANHELSENLRRLSLEVFKASRRVS